MAASSQKSSYRNSLPLNRGDSDGVLSTDSHINRSYDPRRTQSCTSVYLTATPVLGATSRRYRLPRALRFTQRKAYSKEKQSGNLDNTGRDLESPRYVYFNSNPEHELCYPSNEVYTTKYTWWSFVPVFLYFTLSKMANLYFLLIGILQMIPAISTTNGLPMMYLPLSIVIVIDAVFAAYEDYKRHLADKLSNSVPVERFNQNLGRYEIVQRHELNVGDIIKLKNKEVIPADILLLEVGTNDGTPSTGECYVQTTNLDGETNLKLKEPPICTDEFSFEKGLECSFQGFLECETPNSDTNNFAGVMYVTDMDKCPINMKNMLLRGCTLRNTPCIYGLVVNTGVDTKIMMSSDDVYLVKQSSIDIITNQQVIIVVFLLIFLCFCGATAQTLTKEYKWYLEITHYTYQVSYFALFTALASVVPVTLYVSVTMVKALQVYFMQQDLEMYYDEKDAPMIARNMQLNEELGQISHIFSDKTGTLTCNKMDFKKCSINGIAYSDSSSEQNTFNDTQDNNNLKLNKQPSSLERFSLLNDIEKKDSAWAYRSMERSDQDLEDPAYFLKKTISLGTPKTPLEDKESSLLDHLRGDYGENQKKKIKDFFLHLAVCHSVVIEENENKDKDGVEISYSASSPDEQALVNGAKRYGFEFASRTPGRLAVRCSDGQYIIYEILQIFEFDSDRKRMSVITRRVDTNQIELLCKGADNIIMNLLNKESGSEAEAVKSSTVSHLQNFAKNGLRTLLIASKKISEADWDTFSLSYNRELNNPTQVELKKQGKTNKIDQLQNNFERDLTLLGATGIEDRLQDGVPETMEILAKAGIMLWMLTGDMQETAINIGFSCRLLTNDFVLTRINTSQFPTQQKIVNYLNNKYSERKNARESGEALPNLALIIDGASLSHLLGTKFSLSLLKYALECKIVIACRVSPQQKAQLVCLVQENCPQIRTLAVGDGANDVPMIQAANIGVGIIGEEGRQAVNNSDYALGQFRFLQRLILVHGRWNYYRVANLILYTFYKNFVFCVAMFWFMFSISNYSGSILYDPFIQNGFNLLFTAAPIVIYATTDQDIPSSLVFKHPQVYQLSLMNSFFNYKLFWLWMLLAIVDSLGVLWLPLYFMGWSFNDLRGMELKVLGSSGFVSLCVVINVKLCLFINNWHWIQAVGIIGSIIATLLCLYIVDLIPWTFSQDAFPFLFTQIQFWLVQIIVVFCVLLKDFTWFAYRRCFQPKYIQLMKEVDRYQLVDHLDDYKIPTIDFCKLISTTVNEETEVIIEEEREVDQQQQSSNYLGFTFDPPATIAKWIVQVPNLFRASYITGLQLRQLVLSSPDPVIFENQRFQPFLGYGSTYPGHMLPSERGQWSDRSGALTSIEMSTDGLQIDLSVPGCDEEGWTYASSFKRFDNPKRKHTKRRGFVRRRHWIEIRRK